MLAVAVLSSECQNAWDTAERMPVQTTCSDCAYASLLRRILRFLRFCEHHLLIYTSENSDEEGIF